MISVIIPAHNCADTLGQQLHALCNQEYHGEWEIIVVDNCSTDGTHKIVTNYQLQMPWLRLIRACEKRGSGYARNVGLEAARGNTFLFCDADDIVAPDWLKGLADALQMYDLVSGRIEFASFNGAALPKRTTANVGAKHLAANFMPYVMGCNFGVTRKAVEEVGGFNEELLRSQDVEFSWRLQLKGYQIHDAPEAVVYYRLREEIRSIWSQSVSIGKSEVELYRYYQSYGMPRESFSEVFRNYKLLLKKGFYLIRMKPSARLNWLRRVAVRWGRLKGSLYWRLLYL